METPVMLQRGHVERILERGVCAFVETKFDIVTRKTQITQKRLWFMINGSGFMVDSEHE